MYYTCASIECVKPLRAAREKRERVKVSQEMSYEDYADSAEARRDAHYEEQARIEPLHECHVCGEADRDDRGWECDVDHTCANWICRSCATELQREMDCCSDECALRKIAAMYDELAWMSKEIRSRRAA